MPVEITIKVAAESMTHAANLAAVAVTQLRESKFEGAHSSAQGRMTYRVTNLAAPPLPRTLMEVFADEPEEAVDSGPMAPTLGGQA
jgi:hypothetical protein